MPKYRLSNRAKQDVREIRTYSVANWGAERAYRYISALYAGCERIENFPEIGWPIHLEDDIRIFRYECEEHTIFYRVVAGQVRVVRFLHKSMLPTKSQLS